MFAGWIVARHVRFPAFLRVQFGRILFVTDTIGMAAVTIIGAKVAILAGLAWFGGLILLSLLHFASDVPAVTTYVIVSICVTMGITCYPVSSSMLSASARL